MNWSAVGGCWIQSNFHSSLMERIQLWLNLLISLYLVCLHSSHSTCRDLNRYRDSNLWRQTFLLFLFFNLFFSFIKERWDWVGCLSELVFGIKLIPRAREEKENKQPKKKPLIDWLNRLKAAWLNKFNLFYNSAFNPAQRRQLSFIQIFSLEFETMPSFKLRLSWPHSFFLFIEVRLNDWREWNQTEIK